MKLEKKPIIVGAIILLLIVIFFSKQGCVIKGETCCKNDSCIQANVLCEEGTSPVFKGCDDNCRPIVICE